MEEVKIFSYMGYSQHWTIPFRGHIWMDGNAGNLGKGGSMGHGWLTNRLTSPMGREGAVIPSLGRTLWNKLQVYFYTQVWGVLKKVKNNVLIHFKALLYTNTYKICYI